jgi:hypothetical protein
VTKEADTQKGDADAPQWWVTSEGASCRYLRDWIATKVRWSLRVDENEEEALSERADHCPNSPMTVTPA